MAIQEWYFEVARVKLTWLRQRYATQVRSEIAAGALGRRDVKTPRALNFRVPIRRPPLFEF